MSIVKMKHVRLFGMTSHRQTILDQLQKLGCVEIRQPADKINDPDWAVLTQTDMTGLSHAKEQAHLLKGALESLNRCQKAKGGLLTPRREISYDTLFDADLHSRAMTTASSIFDLEKNLAGLHAEKTKLESQSTSLTPWLELDLPLDTTGTADMSVTFGAVMSTTDLHQLQAQLASEAELVELIPAGKDREFQYVVVLCHKKAEDSAFELLKSVGFSRSTLRGFEGTAKTNLTALQTRLTALETEVTATQDQIASFLPMREDLQTCSDRMEQSIQQETCKGNLLESESTFFLEGWFPADSESGLADVLAQYPTAWESREPTADEYPTVPTKLKNNRFTKPLNMVTEMYALPAYDGIDPNPLMAPFFILFYGIMMADMGYGLVMILASLLVLKKGKPQGGAHNLMALLGLCGASTFVFGLLTGGFFGDFIPQLLLLINPESTFALPTVFTPLGDTLAILIGSLILGFIQVITGMIVSVVKQTKDGKFKDAFFNEIAWWIILAGGVVMGLGYTPLVLYAGGIILTVGQFTSKGLLGGIGGLIGAVYNGVTGLFSDVLSYSRLMALMLAGSIIASVFNTLGSVTNNVFLFIIIAMLGNTLNFILNVLGCFVHDLRLQCLEYFGRFYKDGGKPFRPLSIQTNYVAIIKEEN